MSADVNARQLTEEAPEEEQDLPLPQEQASFEEDEKEVLSEENQHVRFRYEPDVSGQAVVEETAERIASVTASYTRNGHETVRLVNGTDFSIDEEKTETGWQYHYEFRPHLFREDGEYRIDILSKDENGRVSSNVSAGTPIMFTVDTTAPGLIITGLLDQAVYREDRHRFSVTILENSKYRFRILRDGETWEDYIWDAGIWESLCNKNVKLLPDGNTVTLWIDADQKEHEYRFYAVDRYRNSCITDPYLVTVLGKGSNIVIWLLPFAAVGIFAISGTAIIRKMEQTKKPDKGKRRKKRDKGFLCPADGLMKKRS